MHAEFMILKNLAHINTSLSQYKNIAISSGRTRQKTNLMPMMGLELATARFYTKWLLNCLAQWLEHLVCSVHVLFDT